MEREKEVMKESSIAVRECGFREHILLERPLESAPGKLPRIGRFLVGAAGWRVGCPRCRNRCHLAAGFGCASCFPGSKIQMSQ